ncbi:MAG: lysozyme [Subtercola sp.]|nr:lysozyme [Subtercola sp.]
MPTDGVAGDPTLEQMNEAHNHSMGSTISANEPAASGPNAFSRQAQAVPNAANGGATTQGLDISGWQPTVDWNSVWANGARFVYIKATESDDYSSSYFTSQWAGATNVGMVRGAYHFANPYESSGATQASYFVAHGGGWSVDGKTLPPMLDIEYDPYTGSDHTNACYGLSASAMVAWIRDFSNTVLAKTGTLPMIYSTTGWWRTCTGNSADFGANPLFIASWPSNIASGAGTLPAGWSDYAMWQYADSGIFPGDQDLFNGNLDALKSFASKGSKGGAVGSLVNGSFENSITGWFPGNGTVNQLIYTDPSSAEDGSSFLASNTAVPWHSMAQDVQRTLSVGEQATATIWLRAAWGTFSGQFNLWGIGNTQESASTPFTVGTTWQKFTVRLPVVSSSHSSLRFEVYMTTTGDTLFLDNATLSFGAAPVAPVVRPSENLLSNPGFEGQLGGWIPGNGDINRAVWQDASVAHSGTWFGAANTATPAHSLAQEVPASPGIGDDYVFSIWVKAGGGVTQPFSGRLALWGLGGGPNLSNGVDFTATSQWTQVSVTVNITRGGVTVLKPEIYLFTTGINLLVDDASLTHKLLRSGSFEGNSFSGWSTSASSMNWAVFTGPQTGVTPEEGTYFLASNTSVSGNSLSQQIARTTNVGETYTAEVWVRSFNPNQTFTGTLALWGLGGTTEGSSTDFTVGGTWTKLTVTLPITNAGHTQLKFEVYERTTGQLLLLDAAQVY